MSAEPAFVSLRDEATERERVLSISRHAVLKAVRGEPANDNRPQKKGLSLVSAEALLSMHFPPVAYVIPGMIVEGLTILGGRPKLGKSWLVMGGCIAVATGGSAFGRAQCEQGDVLYLALEDNQRRLNDRMRKLMPQLVQRPDLSRLATTTDALKIGDGLIEALEQWRISVPNPRMVVVDTFQKVRRPKKGSQGLYENDYEDAGALQRYAIENRLAVVLVTHVRKSEAEDPLEMISGSNGLTGAADSILVLDRDSNGVKLYGRGRDLEEFDWAMRLEDGHWRVLGEVEEAQRSDQRSEILGALRAAGQPIGPTEVADRIGMKPDNVRFLLGKMVEAGQIEKQGRGLYTPAHFAHIPHIETP